MTALEPQRPASIPIALGPSKQSVMGQGFRFALSGGLVALVYVGVTTLLHDGMAVPFQLALVGGSAVSVSLHFTLQRLFVWRHAQAGFALSVRGQARRYLLLVGVQYAITALATSQLPGLLDEPVEIVYLTTTILVAISNFMIFRNRVFHTAGSSSGARDERAPDELPGGAR